MPPVEFESTISAGEQQQSNTLHRAANGTDGHTDRQAIILYLHFSLSTGESRNNFPTSVSPPRSPSLTLYLPWPLCLVQRRVTFAFETSQSICTTSVTLVQARVFTLRHRTHTYEGVSRIFRTDSVKIIKLTVRPIGRHHPRSSSLPHVDTDPTISSIF
jgi:hypothetical protein